MAIRRSQIVWGGVVVAASVLVALVWPKRPDTPEEQVRHEVIQLADAAERRDLKFLMAHVSDRFSSSEGWDKAALGHVLGGELERGQWIRVFPVTLEIHESGEGRVALGATFVMGSSPATDIKELARTSKLGGERIDGVLEREPDGVYRFIRASHRPMSEAELIRLPN